MLLTARNLGREVEAEWLWRHLSFDVEAGDRLAIAGPSGSGKTLLLRTLAALEPLEEGQIHYQGRSLAKWARPAYRAEVMYLAQSPSFVEGTVEENLQVPFSFEAHRNQAYEEGSILRQLRRVGRNETFLQRPARALSGGEQQIVALLRALQLDPTLILLDEPTANLDAGTAEQVEELIDNWMNEQSGRSLVWTSHNQMQLRRVTDRQLRLDRSTSPAESHE